MNILLVSPLPPPVGGIASWTVNILDYYKDCNDFNLIHLNTAIKNRSITDLSLMSRMKSGVKDSSEILMSVNKNIRYHKPDIIHMTSSASFGLFRDFSILIISSFYKVPVITHFRFGRIPTLKISNNWEWKILMKVTSLSSAVIVLDKESREVLSDSGFKDIQVIPNPISKHVEECSQEVLNPFHSVTKPTIQVIFVGHVTKNKGVIELVEACSLIEGIDEILLIGPCEPAMKDELLEKLSNSNLKVIFTGVLEKNSVLAAMKRASVLVLPSYSEGFPNVVIEAMAMGCPIVATDVGAVSDMLDMYSDYPAGIIVKPRDVESLALAIIEILTDRIKTELYIKNALKKVKKNYTLNSVCMSYEKVWKSIVYK